MIMDHISSLSLLQHKAGNCLDIGLSLAADCPQERERYRISSSKIPTRYDRGDDDDVEVDKVVKQEDTVRSAMKRQTAVSFLDWGNKDEYGDLRNGEKDRNLERMGSGISTLSGCGDSDGSGDDPRKLSSLQYKTDGAPWGVQRVWLGSFNEQAIQDFKPAEQDHIDKATVKFEEDNRQEKLSQGVEQSGGEDDKKKPSREHMFDKAVTPSDVGKLNRLVIPKQHAEKFFPLDTNANEKGLLLNFEDNMGKAWRFRYSYWNSSQSYVLTKGWSRFVKEKKLYAGDIVSFERGTEQNMHRLFISWRRRPCVPVQPSFADPSKALLPALPSLARPHIQYRPFHHHGLNISSAGAVGRQPQLQGTVIPACSKVFPQWMSLVWPDNGGGTSSRAAAISMGSEMWAPGRALVQPHQMDAYYHAHARSADLTDMNRVPLDFMPLSAPEQSPSDVLWPMETRPGTGFDPSTSKKGVRLFGVNL